MYTVDIVLDMILVDVETTMTDFITYTPFLFNTIYVQDTDHGCGAWLQALLLAWVPARHAGSDCFQDSSQCVVPLRFRLTGLLRAARNGKKEGGDRELHRPAGNEHRRRAQCKGGCRAEQHVQTLTAQLLTLIRNPTTQAQVRMTGLLDTKLW